MTREQRRQEVFRAVASLSLDGVPPTIREIKEHLGYRSTYGVQRALSDLRALGLVDWQPERSRTLRLTEAGRVAR
jgi:SOS-response transcriptional repressor LexA